MIDCDQLLGSTDHRIQCVPGLYQRNAILDYISHHTLNERMDRIQSWIDSSNWIWLLVWPQVIVRRISANCFDWTERQSISAPKDRRLTSRHIISYNWDLQKWFMNFILIEFNITFEPLVLDWTQILMFIESDKRFSRISQMALRAKGNTSTLLSVVQRITCICNWFQK